MRSTSAVLYWTLTIFGVTALAILLLKDANSYLLYVINLTLINAIAAIGLALLSGVAGQVSLGTAGLLAVSAYVTAILMTHLGLGFLPSALAGAIGAMFIGTLLAAPALRLSGMHLAIVTLAFGTIIVQFIGKGGDLTGGMSGLFVPTASILGWDADTEFKRFLLILVPFLIATITTWNFVRLKPGRALHVLRDQEDIARTIGINTSGYKILTFAFSAFLCGISGALLAALKGYVSVDDFTIWHSLYFFVMIVIGGMTSILGGVIGAVVVTVLPELLRGFQESAQAVFGIVTVLIFLFLPGGIVGTAKRLWAARVATRGSTTERDRL